MRILLLAGFAAIATTGLMADKCTYVAPTTQSISKCEGFTDQTACSADASCAWSDTTGCAAK